MEFNCSGQISQNINVNSILQWRNYEVQDALTQDKLCTSLFLWMTSDPSVAEKEPTYIMWMLCVELLSVSLEGCFGIIRRRREDTVCGRQILTFTDGPLTEIIKMFIKAVDP